MDDLYFKMLRPHKAKMLETYFTVEERTKAIFDLRGEGVPRLEGFRMVFFRKFLELVKDEIQQFFKEFHENGQISGVV